MATVEFLNKSEFLRWIKTVIGLYHVKQGILGFVVKYINEFHTQTFEKVDCSSCSDCSKGAVCKQCEKKLQKLLWQNHRFNKQKFSNISLTKSIHNPWELARYFMNDVQQEMESPETTDCSAVISIIVNNKFLETKINNVVMDCETDVFSKTRVVRNRLFHSGDFKLSQDHLEEYLQRMIDLLRCATEFDQRLISELEELKSEDYFFTKVPAKLIIYELVGGITGKMEEIRNQMQNGFKVIANNLKDHAATNNETSKDLNLVDFFNEIHEKNKEYFKRKNDDAVYNTETLRKLEEENDRIAAEVSELTKYKNFVETLGLQTVRLLWRVTRGDLNMGDVYISAAKFLNDGRLLASDTPNRRLLMFNSNFDLIKQFPVDRKPCGLCLSADSTTVYVVCDNNKVVTYRLQGGLQETSQFKTKQNTYYGLDRSGDTLICGTRTHVVLYNKDGQYLSSITKNLKKGRIRTAICTSVNGDMFYYTINNTLVGVTFQDRQEIFRYSHPSLEYASGIDCDRGGNILVAGRNSHNIHQVSRDGQNGRILLDKLSSIEHPCCVCCHPRRNVFVVTSCNEDTVMEIYEFC